MRKHFFSYGFTKDWSKKCNIINQPKPFKYIILGLSIRSLSPGALRVRVWAYARARARIDFFLLDKCVIRFFLNANLIKRRKLFELLWITLFHNLVQFSISPDKKGAAAAKQQRLRRKDGNNSIENKMMIMMVVEKWRLKRTEQPCII